MRSLPDFTRVSRLAFTFSAQVQTQFPHPILLQTLFLFLSFHQGTLLCQQNMKPVLEGFLHLLISFYLKVMAAKVRSRVDCTQDRGWEFLRMRVEAFPRTQIPLHITLGKAKKSRVKDMRTVSKTLFPLIMRI